MSVLDNIRQFFSREPVESGEPAEPVMRRVELRAIESRPRRALPGFKGLVNRPRSVSQAQARLDRTRAQVRDVFAPTQPVTDERVFAGRLPVLKHLIEVIEHRMSHVVMFGERGIGKTSLLHILSRLAAESDYVVLRATCGGRTEFVSMFRAMLKQVPLRYHSSISPTSERQEAGTGLAGLLPEGEFDARELSEVLSGITSTRILILLDEYDRIESEAFRQSIAELIKNLSDAAARVQLVIAGVSSNLDELIGYVPSIRRNIIGVPVQRLSDDEVGEIIRIGEEASGLQFDEATTRRIGLLANGSPYLVRLIAYHSSMIAVDAGRFDVRESDVIAAIDRIVEETESRLPAVIAQRVRAIDPLRDPQALGELARIAGTPNGWFEVEEVAQPNLVSLVGRFVDAKLIERKDLGGRDSLRFIDEGLPNFLWILGASTAR